MIWTEDSPPFVVDIVECIALIVIYLNKISLFLLKIYNT